MQLKSLSFDLTNCFCPSGNCRSEIFEFLMREMGKKGPWWRTGSRHGLSSIRKSPNQTPLPSTTKETVIVVKGLMSEAEAEIVHRK